MVLGMRADLDEDGLLPIPMLDADGNVVRVCGTGYSTVVSQTTSCLKWVPLACTLAACLHMPCIRPPRMGPGRGPGSEVSWTTRKTAMFGRTTLA